MILPEEVGPWFCGVCGVNAEFREANSMWPEGHYCPLCGADESRLTQCEFCPDCERYWPVNNAHYCPTLMKVKNPPSWEKVQEELQRAEEPPSIEEYEAAVEEFTQRVADSPVKGIQSKIPAEMIRYDQIIVGDRFRKEYNKIPELAESIHKFGLLQYPVIDEANNLIAGGRRMEAIRTLNWTFIPVVRKKNISPLRLRELELEENIQREDLTWAEQVALKEEVLRLKQELYGVKGTGRGAANMAGTGAVSQADVAEIFGDSPATFSLDLQLARAIKEIPELANCKTKDEARKKLKALQEKLIVDELDRRAKERQAQGTSAAATGGEAIQGAATEQNLGVECNNDNNGRSGNPLTDLYCKADGAFIIMDAIAGLRALPDAAPFGFINVDTPYGIDLNATKKKDGNSTGQVIEHDYREWEAADFMGNCRSVAAECFRIAPQDCSMTWWFAMQWFQPLKEMLEEVGWKVDPIPCIWDAGNQGQTNQPELYLARTYEPFFHCRKGQPIINKRGRSNQFHFNKLTADKKIHPTEKPVELMEELYATFAPPSCSVLVPFLGSGNDLVACYKSGRDGLGFDLNAEVKKRFLVRIAEMGGLKR